MHYTPQIRKSAYSVKNTVIHIFSNVIDLDDFDGKRIADILTRDK